MDFMSKTEDVVWLAYKLKKLMKGKVHINEFGLYQEVLSGRYGNEYRAFDALDFHIKYSTNEFLRVTVGEMCESAPYEQKLKALNEFYDVIKNIVDKNGIEIGEPISFYNTSSEKYKIPHLEWAFTKRDEYASELANGTLFDDAEVENLFLFGAEVEDYKKEPQLIKK